MLPQVIIEIKPYALGLHAGPAHSHKPSQTLINWILAMDIQDRLLLDIGCGSGGLTFELAPRAKAIVGVDISPEEIRRAKELAVQKNLTLIKFIQGDAEKVSYEELLDGKRPDMIVANLCMSDEIVQRSAEALEKGSYLVFACLHQDQWIETGAPSRFAYTEERLAQVLENAGFAVESFQIEKEIVKFTSREEMTDLYFKESLLKAKWIQDGRWERWLQYVDQGGRSLTVKSHNLVKARKK